MCYFHLGITVPAFLRQLHDALTLSSWSFWLGLIRRRSLRSSSRWCGCFEGLRVEGNAGSVGRQTTRSVVESIFLVIVFRRRLFHPVFVAADLAMVMRRITQARGPHYGRGGDQDSRAGECAGRKFDPRQSRSRRETRRSVGSRWRFGWPENPSCCAPSSDSTGRTEGMIRIFGEDIGELHGQPLRALQMRWGVLFQEGALFSSQTVAENIQVPLREYTHNVAEADGRDRGDQARHGRLAGRCRQKVSFSAFRRDEVSAQASPARLPSIRRSYFLMNQRPAWTPSRPINSTSSFVACKRVSI